MRQAQLVKNLQSFLVLLRKRMQFYEDLTNLILQFVENLEKLRMMKDIKKPCLFTTLGKSWNQKFSVIALQSIGSIFALLITTRKCVLYRSSQSLACIVQCVGKWRTWNDRFLCSLYLRKFKFVWILLWNFRRLMAIFFWAYKSKFYRRRKRRKKKINVVSESYENDFFESCYERLFVLEWKRRFLFDQLMIFVWYLHQIRTI